jgi:hypothetical protein
MISAPMARITRNFSPNRSVASSSPPSVAQEGWITPACPSGTSDVAIREAMAATKMIPIVFTTASDPVRAGFVSSLGRPGGNVTGTTFMGVELVAKRMELLHEVLPGIARIALLVNQNNPGLMQDNLELSRPRCNGSGWR